MTPTLLEAVTGRWCPVVGRQTPWGKIVEVGPKSFKIQTDCGGDVWEWTMDGKSKVHKNLNLGIPTFHKSYGMLDITVGDGRITIRPGIDHTVYISDDEVSIERKKDSVLEITPERIKVLI